MQKYSLYILLLGILLVQCTKKAADTMQTEGTTIVDDAANALAWRSEAPGAGEARAIELGKASSFDMANGLKVIIVENHKLPRVSYQLSLNNDPILENDQVGYVSVAGSLMSTGTKTKSKAEIDEAIDYIGASLNTSGSGVFASGLKKHSGKLLDIMTDVLYNPSFPEAEFKKIQTQTLSNLASSTTNADAMAGNVAAVVNYGVNHPYGEIQSEDDVNNMTLDNIKAYYNTYFKPNNAYLIIVGDITPDEAKVDAERYFSSWKSGKIPETKYDSPTGPAATNVSFANKDGAVQSVIRVTYPVDLKPGDADIVSSSVMNNILGGGIFSGRLMQNLREDKAYTYGARSNLSSNETIGNFNASASVRNAVTDSSVVQFLYEMERLRNEPVSAEDLQLVKNSMAGSFARSLESPQTIARFARNVYKFGLPADYYDTYLQRLQAVSIADVQAMAQKYIRPDRANIVIAGSKDEVAANLVQFDADGEIDYYDAFGKKLDMNKNTMPEGLTAATVVNDYLDAIGGMAKLKSVNTVLTKMSADVMGQSLGMETGQKDGKMFYMETTMAGNVVQEQRYDGTQAKVGGMGQNQVVTEGKELDALKEQAMPFPQMAYASATSGYKINLKGMEDVGGSKAYKLEVEKPTGEKSYEFYDVKTNLMVRSTTSQEGPDGTSMTITSDAGDYKEVDGVMFPHLFSITGMMPFPLEMKVESITVNSTIPASKFATK